MCRPGLKGTRKQPDLISLCGRLGAREASSLVVAGSRLGQGKRHQQLRSALVVAVSAGIFEGASHDMGSMRRKSWRLAGAYPSVTEHVSLDITAACQRRSEVAEYRSHMCRRDSLETKWPTLNSHYYVPGENHPSMWQLGDPAARSFSGNRPGLGSEHAIYAVLLV